jgi:hypothetical protein
MCETATIQVPDLKSIKLKADPMQTDGEDLTKYIRDFSSSYTYDGGSRIGLVTAKNDCGPLSYTFTSDETADGSYLSMNGSMLTFAPTYDNALGSDGKSVIQERGKAKVDVTLSVGLADYENVAPATTGFEVSFGPSNKRNDCVYDEISFPPSSTLGLQRYTYLIGSHSEQSIDVGIH